MAKFIAFAATGTRLFRVPFLLSILLLTACIATPQSDQLLAERGSSVTTSHELTDVAFFPQQKYQCGPAALATLLADSGVQVTPQQLVDMVYLPERKGSFQVEMLAAARRHQRLPYVIQPHIRHLLKEVEAGKPVLVMQNLGLDWYPQWHYAVVVGFDLATEKLILRSGTLQRRMTDIKTFENTWRRADYWGFVLLKPGQLPVNAQQKNYFLTVADFSRQGDKAAISQALRAGVEKWPNDVHLLMALANHYYALGDTSSAIGVYEDLINKAADYAPAHNNLALLLLELGEQRKAMEHARLAVALGGRFTADYQHTLQKIQE